MVLHSIGRSEGPSVTNAWISKYIFPGGYIPSLSEVLSAVQKSGLLVTDIEILRLHYAETLKHWRERFLAHREEVERIYDQRFVRMWEFYLAASEMAFREQNMMVFQLQLTKRQNVVPMTRDYIVREEQRLRAGRNRAPPAVAAGGRVDAVQACAPEHRSRKNPAACPHRFSLVNCGHVNALFPARPKRACYATIFRVSKDIMAPIDSALRKQLEACPAVSLRSAQYRGGTGAAGRDPGQ